MSIFINADDFGLSEGANRRILNAFDYGVLNGASILANGAAFDSAVREYRKRPGLVLSVHLNLLEGPPLAFPEKIPLLVDARGRLNGSFSKLASQYYLSGSRQRSELLRQLRLELFAQITKVKNALHKGATLRLDSHQHLHMLPFIFTLLAEAKKELGIDYIRLPNEHFFFYSGHKDFLRSYLGPNLIKHFLLKWLSGSAKRKCQARGIASCDHFVGVLFTGSMTLGVMAAAVKSLSPSLKTEVLFHPGRPDDAEKTLWKNREDLRTYYYDEWREKELCTLLSPEFKKFLFSMTNYESIPRSR